MKYQAFQGLYKACTSPEKKCGSVSLVGHVSTRIWEGPPTQLNNADSHIYRDPKSVTVTFKSIDGWHPCTPTQAEAESEQEKE